MATEQRRARRAVLAACAAAEGLAGLVLVVRDGSPVWQLARAALVLVLTAVVVLALVRGGPRSRATAAFVAGIVGVTAGIGLGLGHLLRAGGPLVTAAGLTCLGAGLVLLVAGTVGLTRSVHGWRRPLVAVTTVVVTVLVVLPGWQAVYATNTPRPALGSISPADLGLSYRDVAFRTPDGVRLSGWYLPSRNGAAVALLHGAGSTRSAVLPQAAVLARHGYGVLLYDARGHGRSSGRAMDFGWFGDQDLAGAVSWLCSCPGVDRRRIAAVGLSMGAEQALGAAASDTRIAAVVAEGATGRAAGDDDWLSDEYGVRGAATELWRAVLEFGLTDLLTSAHPPVSLHDAVAEAAPRPVLLIAAERATAEGSAARFIRSAAPRSVQVWTVPGADHTGGLRTRPREWETRVTGFLDGAVPVRR